MKNEKIADALNEIDDTYLAQAAQSPARRRPYWIMAVAAILAIVLNLSMIPGSNIDPTQPNLEVPGTESRPAPTQPPTNGSIIPPNVGHIGSIDLSALSELPNLLAAPVIPQLVNFPIWNEYNGNHIAYEEAKTQWANSQAAQFNQPDGYADSLMDFFHRSIAQFLDGSENGAYSPVNVYLAMAMLAETTGGNSRQEILDLFGADSIETLRQQASHLWNAHYNNDGQTTLLLGNSLWLDHAYRFKSDVVNRLSQDYYASVFGGDLGSDESNAQLQAWLNTMTGGLLEEQTKNTELSEYACFALASTIYFKAGWKEEFPESLTAEGTFHAYSGDRTAMFMQNYVNGFVYYGSNFSAVQLSLTGCNGMWIILPDEGVTVAQVLGGEEYLNLTLDPNSWKDKTYGLIHITLPKFDVTSKSDLINGMKKLGLKDIFDYTVADFTPMTSDSNMLSVTQIDHAARVVIDEKGVVAAAYTVIEVDDEAAPPQIIEFVADRPFAFIVSSQDNLPLFAGTVVEP